jgi:hypothetical protein
MVARRHIERETTTGSMKDGSCEPATPSGSPPSLADLKAFRGVYELIGVSTHPDAPGKSYILTLSLWGRESAIDRRDLRMDGLSYGPATKKPGSPASAYAARFSGKPGAVALTIGPQSMCFDCEETEYWVRGQTSRGFTGSWEPIYGLGVPRNELGEITRDGGYFCATRVRREPLEQLPSPDAQRRIVQRALTAGLPRQPIIAYIDSGQQQVVVRVVDSTGHAMEAALAQLSADSSGGSASSSAQSSTAATGVARFSNIADGIHILTVRRLGYKMVRVPIIVGRQTTVVTVTLVADFSGPCEFCVIVPRKG